MLGNPSESNLKQTINREENPMVTPVNDQKQAEPPVTNRVTCRQTNTPEERPEVAPLITLMGSDSTLQVVGWSSFLWTIHIVASRLAQKAPCARWMTPAPSL